MSRHPIAERFGENLQRCRNEAGISQEDLGFTSSLHRTQVGSLERGERLPRIDTLVKLAGGLEVEPSELLRGLKWRPGQMTMGGFDVRQGEEVV